MSDLSNSFLTRLLGVHNRDYDHGDWFLCNFHPYIIASDSDIQNQRQQSLDGNCTNKSADATSETFFA